MHLIEKGLAKSTSQLKCSRDPMLSGFLCGNSYRFSLCQQDKTFSGSRKRR